MAKHLETGKKAEILAGIFLEEKGYEILARNYRYGRAEIDLIVKKIICMWEYNLKDSCCMIKK